MVDTQLRMSHMNHMTTSDVLLKCAVMSCWIVANVQRCILALSNVSSFSHTASIDERLGRKPCCSSLVSDASKLSRVFFPTRYFKHVLNSAGTLPIMRRVWICRTPAFFSSMKSVIVVQRVYKAVCEWKAE